MSSQLVGLMRRLTWSDFTRELDVPLPGPGEDVIAAETKTDVPDIPFGFRVIPGSAPPKFTFDDNMTVRVVFDPTASWRAVWVKTMPQAEQDRLLQHEQGHYSIAALMARDFFLDLMQLKGKVYGKREDALADVGKLKSGILARINPLQKKYDGDTKHGSDQAAQNRWNWALSAAFTSPRTPPAVAADSVRLKVRLLDAVRAAGIVF